MDHNHVAGRCTISRVLAMLSICSPAIFSGHQPGSGITADLLDDM
jgi:hypothetical protein